MCSNLGEILNFRLFLATRYNGEYLRGGGPEARPAARLASDLYRLKAGKLCFHVNRFFPCLANNAPRGQNEVFDDNGGCGGGNGRVGDGQKQ